MELSRHELTLIEALQEEIPLERRPYRTIAEKTGMQEDEVIAVIGKLKERGVIRRIGAVLAHRALGIDANAMVLWAVPEERIEEIGKKLAEFPEVTHCYYRDVPASWSYNLFTMVHARDRRTCLEKVKRIADVIGLSDYQVLFSSRELKKSGIHLQYMGGLRDEGEY
ncbi:MAG: Lrp/AsnC family transcriptional regulator [Thermacetogeniaceae bacterium]